MITKPNYTQVPNVLFDEIMENLTGAELKVMLCLCRKIFGWHKEKDKISISQIIKMTGLGKTQIIKSLKTLEKMNLVMSIKEFGRTTEYSLIIEESERVQKVNTQKKILKKLNKRKIPFLNFGIINMTKK